ALLADDTDADELYLRAIGHLRRTRLRPELARTHLLYGEWLPRPNPRRAPPAAATHEPSCRRPTTCSCRWESTGSPNAVDTNCCRPGRPCESARSNRTGSSPR